MKKWLLCAAAFLMLAATSAMAADIPVKAPVYKAPVVVPYSWTGFYIGANIGYSWGKADSTLTIPSLVALGLPATFTDSLKPQGIIGGGQIGYNWQASRNWVLGIEADFQGSGQKDSNSFSDPFSFFTIQICDCQNGFILISNPGTATFAHEEKLQWFGTVRGRIGFAFANGVMLYGTGGLAYGHVSSSTTVTLATIGSQQVNFANSDTKAGWTLGGGFEGAVPNTRDWTWKAEYLYIDLGSVSGAGTDPVLGSFSWSTKVTDNIVRVGLNYRFH